MAAKYFSFFIIVCFIEEKRTDNTDFNMESHLKVETVRIHCFHREDVCRSDEVNICALKRVNKKSFFKDFENSCFLLFNNVCDNPGKEYYIVSSGTCDQYLSARRSNGSEEWSALPGNQTEDSTTTTDTNDGHEDTVTKAGDLREGTHDYSSSNGEEVSFTGQTCPHHCQNIYSPVCVRINSGEGKYFKMLSFSNQCYADAYYCANPNVFTPPPGEDEELVKISGLSWSSCGSVRYVQISRFVEFASSMGHYGWLAGNQKPTHIMEPHEKIPGYGKRK